MTRQGTKKHRAKANSQGTHMTANEKAVRAAYTQRSANIGLMLGQIAKRLETHRARFDVQIGAGRVDWGFVGDLGHVGTLLSEISDFLNKE